MLAWRAEKLSIQRLKACFLFASETFLGI